MLLRFRQRQRQPRRGRNSECDRKPKRSPVDRNRQEDWERKAKEKAKELADEAELELRGFADKAESGLKDLADKARAASRGDSSQEDAPQEPGETVALEARPEEVKTLYARILAAQCLVDGRLDPRELEYLYIFMSRVDLGQDSREEVRGSLNTEDGEEAGAAEGLALVEQVVAEVPGDEEEISVSLLKDMTQVSRADGVVAESEEETIRAVAEARFGERAERVIELARKTVEYEEALLKGDVEAGELEGHAKEIASVAAGAGIPITALFFSGSVVGLSAAGITSGLAALGLGGLFGLSAMVTGIGAVVVVGVAAYTGARWLLGGRERELAKQRENMIQEVIKRHQGAIEDLTEDVTGIGLKLAEYVSRSDHNESELARLRGELRMFNAALAELKQEKDNLADKSAQHAG